jgi:hypothetical protein
VGGRWGGGGVNGSIFTTGIFRILQILCKAGARSRAIATKGEGVAKGEGVGKGEGVVKREGSFTSNSWLKSQLIHVKQLAEKKERVLFLKTPLYIDFMW